LAVLSGCLALAFGPLLAAHAGYLWQRPHYQHFPVVPLGAAWLAWRRWPREEQLHPGGGRVRSLLWSGVWGLLAVAVLGWSPWLGMVAALALLPAMGYCLGGGALVRQMLPVWAVLWLLVPLPLGLDSRLIAALQPLVTKASSRVLDLLEVWHVPTGNVLAVESRRILVEEACSGIQSLYSLITCVCLYVLWAGRPLVPAALLLIAAVIASVLANIGRVVATAYLTVVCGINVEDGWRHEAVGMVAFVVSLGLLWSWDHFLWFFCHPAASPRGATAVVSGETESTTSGRVAWLDARLPASRLAIAFGLLGCVQVAILLPDDAPPIAASSVARTFNAESLPAAVGVWRRRDFKSEEHSGKPQGRYSSIWTYEAPAGTATVAIDASYSNWHPLENCYIALGWTLENYEVRHTPTPTGVGDTFVAVRFTKPLESYGYLLYSLHGDRGGSLSPPTPRPWTPSGWVRLCKRFGRSAPEPESTGAIPDDRYEQEQLFVDTSTPLTPAGLADVEAFFFQSRDRLRKR
jgi:exosortase